MKAVLSAIAYATFYLAGQCLRFVLWFLYVTKLWSGRK